jgi:transcriptional regulator with XRE-family HTH domain
MKLKAWREQQGWTQKELAVALEKFAPKQRCYQRLISYWEGGHMPGKAWRKIIYGFTEAQVSAKDF